MKRFLRLVSLTLLIMSTSGNTFAEEKVNVARQGTIRGRIVDTSKQILPGASIYIEKLHTGVTSDVNGYYTFANLTPGTYTVKVSYVGYSPVEMKITIPAGKTLEKDVVLNEGLELQEVVVGGAFQGQRRAINSQKNNLGITSSLSLRLMLTQGINAEYFGRLSVSVNEARSFKSSFTSYLNKRLGSQLT